MRAQQKRFDEWMEEFNREWGHEAMVMKRPAEVHEKSKRVFPKKLEDYEYPEHYLVSKAGTVRIMKHQLLW